MDTERATTEGEFRAKAAWLAAYYEHRAKDEPRPDWEKGLRAAKAWLALIDSPGADPAELLGLLEDPDGGTAWIELRSQARKWLAGRKQ